MRNLITKIKSLFDKSSVIQNVIIVAGGTALGQGIVILASPLLSRLYTPQQFGELSIYISLISIIGVVASFRYEMAIPLPKRDRTASELLLLCLFLVFLISIIVFFVFSCFSTQLIMWTKATTLQQNLWLFPISILGIGLYQALTSWAIRKRAFSYIARTKFNQSLTLVITQIGFGLLHIETIGLLLGQLLSSFVGITTLTRISWKHIYLAFKNISLDRFFLVANRYKKFPLFSSGSALMDNLGSQLPILFLSTFYDPSVAGLFALGQRVVGVPTSLISFSVAQVYLGESARISQENPEQLMTLFLKTAKGLFVVGTPIIVLLTLPSPWTFPLVFGQKWSEAGLYVQVLFPMFLLNFISSPLGSILDVLERQDLHFIREITRIFMVSMAFLLAKLLSHSVLFSIIIFGIANLSIAIFSLAISWYSLKVRINRSL